MSSQRRGDDFRRKAMPVVAESWNVQRHCAGRHIVLDGPLRAQSSDPGRASGIIAAHLILPEWFVSAGAACTRLHQPHATSCAFRLTRPLCRSARRHPCWARADRGDWPCPRTIAPHLSMSMSTSGPQREGAQDCVRLGRCNGLVAPIRDGGVMNQGDRPCHPSAALGPPPSESALRGPPR